MLIGSVYPYSVIHYYDFIDACRYTVIVHCLLSGCEKKSIYITQPDILCNTSYGIMSFIGVMFVRVVIYI